MPDEKIEGDPSPDRAAPSGKESVDEVCARLLIGLKKELPRLRALLDDCNHPWVYEDRMYRFYYHSFKVFDLQDKTIQIVEALKSVLPGREINKDFLQIVREGTGKTFVLNDNERWLQVTRPIVEAFLHGRYFLEMACEYAELAADPKVLPSGWASLLQLYRAWG
jgi:hypothetical protein